MQADAIVAYTHTSETACLLSGTRPKVPILAITDDVKTYHKLSLIENTLPVLVLGAPTIDDSIEKGIEKLEEYGILEKGDTIVIAGGDKILPHKENSHVIGGVVVI